jgi:hypothetical protein
MTRSYTSIISDPVSRDFIYDVAQVFWAGPGEASVVEFEEAEFVEVNPAV